MNQAVTGISMRFLAILMGILIGQLAFSQQHSHLAALTVRVPVGTFAQSHVFGLSGEYNYARARFAVDASPRSLIGLTGTIGIGYLAGKRTTVAANKFKFPGYTEAYILAGIIGNLTENSTVSITAGPVCGLYRGNTDLAVMAKISGNYFIDPRISIGPVASVKKGKDVTSLYEVGIRVGYLLK